MFGLAWRRPAEKGEAEHEHSANQLANGCQEPPSFVAAILQVNTKVNPTAKDKHHSAPMCVTATADRLIFGPELLHPTFHTLLGRKDGQRIVFGIFKMITI